MSYLDRLRQLEPSPLRDTPTFDVAYLIPNGHGWNTHRACSPWGAWWLCKACAELGRPVRVRACETGDTFGTEVALLDLFSYRLSDRSGKGTEE